jgi:hypothetical protein
MNGLTICLGKEAPTGVYQSELKHSEYIVYNTSQVRLNPAYPGDRFAFLSSSDSKIQGENSIFIESPNHIYNWTRSQGSLVSPSQLRAVQVDQV